MAMHSRSRIFLCQKYIGIVRVRLLGTLSRVSGTHTTGTVRTAPHPVRVPSQAREGDRRMLAEG
eukprot:5770971-Prymnesium_polylepis.1